ncbi:discoidin domain-containing protein [Nonomuraea sp. KM88]|uniref:discoidin domain-containing protein n=1 Tax=Nonomuraea sp. KM88 TaxID=3457427 RepID=UPI003FCD9A9E
MSVWSPFRPSRRRSPVSLSSSHRPLDAVAANGASGQTRVTLRHCANLAVNVTGSPCPRVRASSSWAPQSYDVQTSLVGERWTTVRSVTDDAPNAPATTSVTPPQARYVRLRIAEGRYPTQPGHNTQLAEFAVHSAGG